MVSTSLFTGLSGLRTHQRYIDVIGNNLANVSTPGFWGSRATFSDILSFTLRPGAGPNANFGGTNPMQVGLGTKIGSIDLDTNQGTFQDTGRPLDVALQGKGFFTLTDGLQTFYSRVGSFGVDSNRELVDLRTGFRVQSATGAAITVPVTDTLPAQATSSISFQGNLPAEVKGPLEEIVQSSTAFLEGTAAAKTSTPNNTTTTPPTYDISAFLDRTLRVSVNGGAAQTVSFPSSVFGAGTSVAAADLAARFDSIAGLSTSVDTATGAISFETDKLGNQATLKFDDGPGAAGFLTTIGLNATLTSGTQVAASATTDLSSLTARNTDFTNGDQIVVRGTNADATAVSDTFVYGTDGTTVGDLVTFLNATYDATQVTAALDADGNITLTAVEKGEASMSLFIGDQAGNTGTANWPTFRVVQNGTGPDTAVTSIDVVDSLGRSHPVTLTFTRDDTDDTVWNMSATMDASEGTIDATLDSLNEIRFNDDGSFNVIGGGSNVLRFNFTGIGAAQDVTIDLGTSGQFDGVALLGDKATVAATDQDGFGAGSLLNIAFNESGQMLGFYSNGQTQTLDTLRISVFPNRAGLLRAGDTLFIESPNSDDPIATTAGNAGAGVLRSGALENSNVDIAAEFVNLIEAQRGFQANSRVITTTDEILAELVNIVR